MVLTKENAVVSVAPGSLTHVAGFRPGDVLLAVNGQEVKSLAGLYRELWGSGEAGVPVDLALLRDQKMIEVSVMTVDRARIMRRPASH